MEAAADAVFEVLKMSAAVAGLVLLAAAAVGLLLGILRVTVQGRIFVLPFEGSDERRVQLTNLFVDRLSEIERQWVELAGHVGGRLTEFEEHVDRETRIGSQEIPQHATPLADDAAPAQLESWEHVRATPRLADLGAAPRSVGDRYVQEILDLRSDSLAGVDLGVVELAGVSFSPTAVLALLRRLPGTCARRVLNGTLTNVGDKTIATVVLERRAIRRAARSSSRQTCVVVGDEWLSAFDQLAFQLHKRRVETAVKEPHSQRAVRRVIRATLQRPRRSVHDSGRKGWSRWPLTPTVREDVDTERAVIEASSWEAARAFLEGYRAHLRHCVTGSARDREQALERYAAALEVQPLYPSAAFNAATLFYNRYVPEANEYAVRYFEVASGSADERLRALGLAGLSMALCQAINRFDAPRALCIEQAQQAAQMATTLRPELEECRFAAAWVIQVKEQWEEAVARYVALGRDPLPAGSSPSPPERRIRSFALNNAAWIWLYRLDERNDALRHAEELLWEALALYPNKITYANLAELARRYGRLELAMTMFGHALDLDSRYVSGRNERAALLLEVAARAFAANDVESAMDAVRAAYDDHERALLDAGDPGYKAKLRKEFDERLAATGIGEALRERDLDVQGAPLGGS
jgi:tetratricopeptide (TPR) repeat protein